MRKYKTEGSENNQSQKKGHRKLRNISKLHLPDGYLLRRKPLTYRKRPKKIKSMLKHYPLTPQPNSNNQATKIFRFSNFKSRRVITEERNQSSKKRPPSRVVRDQEIIKQIEDKAKFNNLRFDEFLSAIHRTNLRRNKMKILDIAVSQKQIKNDRKERYRNGSLFKKHVFLIMKFINILKRKVKIARKIKAKAQGQAGMEIAHFSENDGYYKLQRGFDLEKNKKTSGIMYFRKQAKQSFDNSSNHPTDSKNSSFVQSSPKIPANTTIDSLAVSFAEVSRLKKHSEVVEVDEHKEWSNDENSQEYQRGAKRRPSQKKSSRLERKSSLESKLHEKEKQVTFFEDIQESKGYGSTKEIRLKPIPKLTKNSSFRSKGKNNSPKNATKPSLKKQKNKRSKFKTDQGKKITTVKFKSRQKDLTSAHFDRAIKLSRGDSAVLKAPLRRVNKRRSLVSNYSHKRNPNKKFSGKNEKLEKPEEKADEKAMAPPSPYASMSMATRKKMTMFPSKNIIDEMHRPIAHDKRINSPTLTKIKLHYERFRSYKQRKEEIEQKIKDELNKVKSMKIARNLQFFKKIEYLGRRGKAGSNSRLGGKLAFKIKSRDMLKQKKAIVRKLIGSKKMNVIDESVENDTSRQSSTRKNRRNYFVRRRRFSSKRSSFGLENSRNFEFDSSNEFRSSSGSGSASGFNTERRSWGKLLALHQQMEKNSSSKVKILM